MSRNLNQKCPVELRHWLLPQSIGPVPVVRSRRLISLTLGVVTALGQLHGSPAWRLPASCTVVQRRSHCALPKTENLVHHETNCSILAMTKRTEASAMSSCAFCWSCRTALAKAPEGKRENRDAANRAVIESVARTKAQQENPVTAIRPAPAQSDRRREGRGRYQRASCSRSPPTSRACFRSGNTTF